MKWPKVLNPKQKEYPIQYSSHRLYPKQHCLVWRKHCIRFSFSIREPYVMKSKVMQPETESLVKYKLYDKGFYHYLETFDNFVFLVFK